MLPSLLNLQECVEMSGGATDHARASLHDLAARIRSQALAADERQCSDRGSRLGGEGGS